MNNKFILTMFLFFFASHCYSHHFIITTPKSGTYLTLKLTSLILKKPVSFYEIPGNDIYNHHGIPDSQDLIISHPYAALNYYISCHDTCIVVIRDIRDAIVSLYHFIEKYQYGPPEYNCLSKDEKIMYLITCECSLNLSLKYYTAQSDKWLKTSSFNPMRFEEMVGPEGGGSRIHQRRSVKRLCAFLGVHRSENEIDQICSQIFGGTFTFKDGKIGSWKDHFTKEHLQAFDENFGKLMQEWGYY